MLKIMTSYINGARINFSGYRNRNSVNFGMSEDIYATSRNGHQLRDMFDKTANTLDIYSNGLYPSNVLSNLAHNPFSLDGVECESIEGFLQSLKDPDENNRKEICKLYGGSAKNAAKLNPDWHKTQKLYWNGKCYDRNSEEYKDLLFSAFFACYTLNNVFRTALDSTKGIKLTHVNGKNDKKETVLTADEFTEILTKLRDESY